MFLFQPFTTKSEVLNAPRMETFENIIKQGGNADSQNFLSFPSSMSFRRKSSSFACNKITDL